MLSFEVERMIAAPADRIWAILTDAEALVRGGLGVTRIDGRIEEGAQIKLWSEAAPDRAFPLRVTAWAPPRRMVWQGGMPFGLFRGVREFTLDDADGGVRFHMREVYSGPMLGLIAKSMPDLSPSFETFARGLQKLSETTRP
ncbi:MAG: SRPBCC domain-containing protein [Terricaulis sp.]